VLFPTIRFALFFAVVMPASWLLTPLGASRGKDSPEHHEPRQPWQGPVVIAVAAALLWLVARSVSWPGPIFVVLVLGAIGVAIIAARRWFALSGLTRWNVFMLAASYFFYGVYDWHFVVLLAGSTMVNQVLASAIHRAGAERARRTFLVLAVAANLGVLAWFKYKGFFTEGASGILEHVSVHIDPPARALIPPVGISFFTFQALSYVIDIYRRRLEPVPILQFAVYLSFFPHVVAGPIVRASEFLPQLRVPRDARKVDSGLAFWLIAVGLFKKVVVSSYLATAAADPVFRLPEQHQALDTLVGIYAYAIQIYCDFSGYTDMAIGLALLLGFRFPQNFDAPYTSSSLQEFWRRWHMTLSRWLRDYLYIPLGGNQRGPRRAMINVFLTMLIGGLWHGAAWTFIIWGALHGGYLAGERTWQDRRADRTPVLDAEGAPVPSRLSPRARLWLGRILTFHVVCLGWVFFRATSLTNAFEVLGRLFHLGSGSGVNLVALTTIAVFLATQFVPTDAVGRLQAWFSGLNVVPQAVSLAAWITFTSALSPTGVAPFIYFNF